MSYRLDRAKELVDLQDWLSDYSDIKSGGGNEIRLKICPECGNDKYKVYVNVEKQAWICYVCEWGRGVGDVVHLMSKVSGRNPTSVRLEILSITPPAPTGNIDGMLQRAFDGSEDDAYEDEVEFIEVPVPGVENFKGITEKGVLAYAQLRGLTIEEVCRFKLRAANSLPSPKKQKPIRGPFIVFPVVAGGKFVSWQGRRVIDKDPRYISASNVKDWVYPLDEEFLTLYNNAGRTLYIVEGVFDAIGMARVGLPAVCTFGMSISDRQMSLIKELQPKKVCFSWDMGSASQVSNAVKRMSHAFPEVYVALTDHPAGKKVDAGDALKSEEAAEWIKTINEDSQLLNVRAPEFFRWRMMKL